MRLIHLRPVTVNAHKEIEKRKRQDRVSNIGRAAVDLGVTREHLSRVIHSKVTSKILSARYQSLQAARQPFGPKATHTT